MAVKENVSALLKEIPVNVRIVAATKSQETRKIKEAVKAGIKIIGENRVQEAEKKFNEFDFSVEKHFIGSLQSNKAKKAAELFDLIQSVDSVKLAQKIDSACSSLGKKMPVLIELNLGEKQKSGISKQEIFVLAEKINELHSLELKGLMFVAPFFEEKEKTIHFFAEAKKVFAELNKKFPSAEILSMGMTEDYVFALKNKSNMIRIGRKIFGERIK